METAPFYKDVAEAPDGGRAVFVNARDGTRIRFVLWNGGTRGLALVLPGRSECVEKYGRMTHELVDRGFSVAILDFRGQGLSDRQDNSTAVGHVGDFSEYQLDLSALLAHPDVDAIPGPHVMFAHSMGGCVGLRALQSEHTFVAAIFSSPMLGLHLPGAKRLYAPLLAKIGVALGLGKKALAGQPKGYYLTREPFEGNNLTHDQNMWDYIRGQIIKYPDLSLGAPSFSWLKSAFDEFKHFHNCVPQAAPSLVFLGSEDTIVDTSTIRRYSQNLKNGTLVEIEGARHEVWMETSVRRQKCWAEIDSFLDRTLGPN